MARAVGTDAHNRLVELVYDYESEEEYIEKHGVTGADLDRMAAPYEEGSFEPEPDGEVFSGSHLDAVGTRRVTVIYDAKAAQRVAMIVDFYLAAKA